jgi:hypothetical protein
MPARLDASANISTPTAWEVFLLTHLTPKGEVSSAEPSNRYTDSKCAGCTKVKATGALEVDLAYLARSSSQNCCHCVIVAYMLATHQEEKATSAYAIAGAAAVGKMKQLPKFTEIDVKNQRVFTRL